MDDLIEHVPAGSPVDLTESLGGPLRYDDVPIMVMRYPVPCAHPRMYPRWSFWVVFAICCFLFLAWATK